MAMSMTTRLSVLLVSFPLVAAGCDGVSGDSQTRGGSAERSAGVAAAPFTERLLAREDRGGVHIEMYEIAPGHLAVSQDREVGTEPFFAKAEVETWDAELLYRRLHPEAAEMPARIKEVALHRRQLGETLRRAAPQPQESAPAETGTPPNPGPAASGQHLLYDFAANDAAWFKRNYCDIGSRGSASVDDHGGPGGYDTFCWTNVGGVGWIKRGNQYDSHISLMSADSTATAEMKFNSVWDCGALWYVECDGTVHDNTVQPRHILTWSTDSGFKSWGNGVWYHHGGYYGSRTQAGMNGD